MTRDQKTSLFYTSPLGTLAIQVKNHKLYAIFKVEKPSSLSKRAVLSSTEKQTDLDMEVAKKAQQFLDSYFSGEETQPVKPTLLSHQRGGHKASLPLFPRGSAFQQKVWSFLSRIPYGTTQCYSDIARSLGSSRLARAVGSACAQNPFLIIVPCHRVLAKQGLGGFALGLKTKKYLLTHEQKGGGFVSI